jgi:hypothetical protein
MGASRRKLAALAVGILVLLRPKGTPVHRRRGRVYALTLLVTHFRIPQKAWLHVHLTCLLTSLYILVGGGVNEVFLRVDILRRLVPTLNPPAIRLTHLGVIIVFLVLIGYFNAVLVRESRRKRRAPPNAPAASFGGQGAALAKAMS